MHEELTVITGDVNHAYRKGASCLNPQVTYIYLVPVHKDIVFFYNDRKSTWFPDPEFHL